MRGELCQYELQKYLQNIVKITKIPRKPITCPQGLGFLVQFARKGLLHSLFLHFFERMCETDSQPASQLAESRQWRQENKRFFSAFWPFVLTLSPCRTCHYHHNARFTFSDRHVRFNEPAHPSGHYLSGHSKRRC